MTNKKIFWRAGVLALVVVSLAGTAGAAEFRADKNGNIAVSNDTDIHFSFLPIQLRFPMYPSSVKKRVISSYFSFSFFRLWRFRHLFFYLGVYDWV